MKPATKRLVELICRETGIPVLDLYSCYLKKGLSTFFNAEALTPGLVEQYWGGSDSVPNNLTICNSGMLARLEASLFELTGSSFTLDTHLRRDGKVYKIFDPSLRRSLLAEEEKRWRGSTTKVLRLSLTRRSSAAKGWTKIETGLDVVHSTGEIRDYKVAHLLGTKAPTGPPAAQFCYLRRAREICLPGAEDGPPSEIPRVSDISWLHQSAPLFREWVCGGDGLVICVHDGVNLPEKKTCLWGGPLLEKAEYQRITVLTCIRPLAPPSTEGQGFVECWKKARVLILTEKGLDLASPEMSFVVLSRQMPSAGTWRHSDSMAVRNRLSENLTPQGRSRGGGGGEEEEEEEEGSVVGAFFRGDAAAARPNRKWPCRCSLCSSAPSEYGENMDLSGPQKQYKKRLDTFELLKLLNLDNARNLELVTKALDMSLLSFDIESYTPPPEEPDCLSVPGITTEGIGHGNAMIGRQRLYCIGLAHGFERGESETFPFKVFEIDEKKDAKAVVRDFWVYVCKLRVVLERRKTKLLLPLLARCAEYEEAHNRFWSERGSMDEKSIEKSAGSQLFGMLKAKLHGISKRVVLFAHNGSRYDFPALLSPLTLAIKGQAPKTRIRIIKNGSSITKISAADVTFADSMGLTPFTSLKEFGRITNCPSVKGIFPHAWFTDPKKLKSKEFPEDPDYFVNISDGRRADPDEIATGAANFRTNFPDMESYMRHYLKVRIITLCSSAASPPGPLSCLGEKRFVVVEISARLLCAGNGVCPVLQNSPRDDRRQHY